MPNETRRTFAKSLAAGLSASALASTGASAAAPGSKPNILFICSDQHGWKYTGFAGHPIVKTPNLDRIATQGVVFSNTYCGSPVCTPGRASMMTGMHASDCGSYCNSTVWDGSHPTWGTRLRRAGYETRATGKLDLNDDFDMGFKEVETSHGHRHGPDITSLFRRPVGYRIGEREDVTGSPRDKRHKDAKLTQNAIEFIRNESRSVGRPWVQYVGLSQPHPSFVALQKYWDQYPLEQIDLPGVPLDYLDRQHLMFQELRHFKRVATPISEKRVRLARRGYYGMIGELDEYVGQLWSALEDTAQLENTVFIYTSDHGEMLGDHGLWYKNNLLDPAARVPLVIAGPGIPKGKSIDTPVAHIDLIATMVEWAGGDSSQLRGHSLAPMIAGESGSHPGFAYSESHSEGNCTGSFMIRKSGWKYIHFTWYDDLLFNLADDPNERLNRVDDPRARPILEELRAILGRQADTEQVTRNAFAKQQAMLDDFARKMSEDELAKMLQGRLGKGLARVMAARAKGANA
jgi:choline-sulfatase